MTLVPPPAVTIAPTRALMSATIAATPPPAVALIGVTPLSSPAGLIELAAVVETTAASKDLAAASLKPFVRNV
jgi:hypothetical protein